ncbi:MAG: histidine--tRNA ligase [Candidatus Dojkabacteria bacterium]
MSKIKNYRKLSNKPLRGTSDWFPDEFRVRKYIFDTWRDVCTRFGYEEYLTPIVENAELYRAKSGEDVGGSELMTFERDGTEYAIRPEMTPSVTRLVSRIIDQVPKPIRYFSIANFMRFQKPQRGRNREFWQLNCDIFGSNSIEAEIEVLQLSLELVLAFNPPKDSFVMKVNNRKLIDFILDSAAGILPEIKVDVVRILDKWEKLSSEEFMTRLQACRLSPEQISILQKFMECRDIHALVQDLPQLEESEGFLETSQVITSLIELGYSDWIQFRPDVIRGFDYYDGLVFEVFDNDPENNRAMFGGGRYNGLAGIFGSQSFPAVGMAPGDESMYLFLEKWGMLESISEQTRPQKIYIPVLLEAARETVMKLANELRAQGNNVETGLEIQQLTRSLQYADRKRFTNIIIIEENELQTMNAQVKNMRTGKQVEVALEKVTECLY